MEKSKSIIIKCDLPGESYQEWWIERKEQIGLPIYRELFNLGATFMRKQDALEKVCEIFSGYIYSWNLADDQGKPLPEPYQNPEAFMQLANVNSDGFLWISRMMQASIIELVEPPEEKS